jgi:hypothetical protein
VIDLPGVEAFAEKEITRLTTRDSSAPAATVAVVQRVTVRGSRRVRHAPGVVRYAADFFCEQDGSSSMVRLCAFLCCVTGCTCGVLTVLIAWRNPTAGTGAILALVAVTTALIASGCVALLLRTQAIPATGDCDHEERR